MERYISILLSLLLLGLGIYESVRLNIGFILPSAIFSIETVIYFLKKGKKKAASIVSLLQSVFAMVSLLICVFLSFEEGSPLPLIIGSGVYSLYHLILFIYYLKSSFKEDLEGHLSKNIHLLSFLYGFNLTLTLLLKAVATESTVLPFLLLIIAFNAVSTFLAAYYALSLTACTYKDKVLTLKEKIAAIATFFVKYHIGFIFGEAFTLFLGITCIPRIKDSEFYIYLVSFYFLIFLMRLIDFIWNKALERKIKDKEILRRRKNVILLVNTIVFLGAGDTLSGALMLMSSIRFTSNMPWWLLIATMIPFSIIGLITGLIERKGGKQKDDPYLYATLNLSLITSSFSLLAGLTYFLRYIEDEQLAVSIWFLFWVALLTLLTAILIIAFVKAIMGFKHRKEEENKA